MARGQRTVPKMIGTIIIAFITPFILPLLLKLLLWCHCFDNIEEFEKIVNIFYNKYTVIYIGIAISLLLWFFYKGNGIKEFLQHRNLAFKVGDKEISAKIIEDTLREQQINKKIIQESDENYKEKENQEAMQEAKMQFGIIKSSDKDTNKACIKCNKIELENENDNLRYFAAYNLINIETKELLHVLYNEQHIEKDKFKDRIIQGYENRKKKNVKLKKKDMEKVSKSKYETIYEGLKFLNIIEPSENDKELKLTTKGKKFVEKYIERSGSYDRSN